MDKGGAPEGNQNALKGKMWNDALRRAIAQDDGKRVRGAVEKLLDFANEGEQWAIKELADRLDGKAKQQTELTGADDAPLFSVIERVIVQTPKE